MLALLLAAASPLVLAQPQAPAASAPSPPGAASEPAADDAALRRAMERARAPGQKALPCDAGETPRAGWVRSGEAALARGDDEAAQLAYERAAALQHCADTEMGLVRTFMQAGQYRRAMAFVAHTASAHRETAGGAVLYAWLLHIGGQVPAARLLLEGAEARWPADPLIAQARRELQSPAPVASGALLAAPVRAAPYARGVPDVRDAGSEGCIAGTRLAASGVLVDAGRRALVPLQALAGAASVRLRDGLGRTRHAQVEREAAALGLAVLALREPLDPQQHPSLPVRDPFPGSPGFSVEYAVTAEALPAWPLLRTGFIGAPRQSLRRLGIAMPAGPRGGPVFDAAGRLAGIAVPALGPDGDLLVPASVLRRELGGWVGEPAPPGPPAQKALDEIYEHALPLTLQLLVGDAPCR